MSTLQTSSPAVNCSSWVRYIVLVDGVVQKVPRAVLVGLISCVLFIFSIYSTRVTSPREEKLVDLSAVCSPRLRGV